MKKFNYICALLMFTIFIPRVYAFTYEVNTSVDSTSVSVGSVHDIKVSLKNIQGTDYGIAACSLKIIFDNNVLLNSKISTLNSWSMTTGDLYVFDTGSAILQDTDMFIIPVKINNNGSLKITNIECSDGETKTSVNDKQIDFVIATNNTGTDNSNSNNGNNSTDDEIGGDTGTGDVGVETSNCNITSLELSEGTIEFDPNVLEYTVKVSDFDSFDVNPVLESSAASYIVERNIIGDEKSVVITVSAPDGSSKAYTIYVNETEINSNAETDKEKNDYTIIFVGIICVLVVINVYRIIKNKKR